LLFRGQVPHGVDSGKAHLTYITPIEDVFLDILDFSKGGITDIKVAGT